MFGCSNHLSYQTLSYLRGNRTHDLLIRFEVSHLSLPLNIFNQRTNFLFLNASTIAILTILALLIPSVVSRSLILSSIESMFAFLDKSTSNFSVTFIRLLSFTTQIYTKKHNFQIFRKVFFQTSTQS